MPECTTTATSSTTIPGPTVGSPADLLSFGEAAKGTTLCP